jgi:hypothetical protein
MSEVFVSYRRDDLAIVSRLVDALRSEGLIVWWDQDIPPNAPWEQTIEAQLSKADVVLVAWSVAAVASESVKAEARWARRHDRLLQVFIEPCEPPLFFGERQGIDLDSWFGNPADASFQALLNAIRARDFRGPSTAATAVQAQPAAAANSSDQGRGLLARGTVLNGLFEVRRLLGAGALVEVYEGTNLTTNERVAIKTFRPGVGVPRALPEAFLRELLVLTRLNHEAIVPYRLAAREPTRGVLYLVSDFVDGISLSALIGQVVAPEPRLRAFTSRLADALKHAHKLGVVHGDVSPDNILLAGGQLEQCTLVDFKFAKPAFQARVAPGLRPYRAPEQHGRFDGEVGPWTDVYGLGRVTLALATGAQPDASAVESADAGENFDGDLASAPPRLQPLLTMMLAADPLKRIRSMDEVLAVIRGPAELAG